MSAQRKLAHHSEERIDRLRSVILKSIFIGGMYGALISVPSELLLRWRSPFYRAFGLRIRIFYHTIWIAAAASFRTERAVLEFENVVRREEEFRRQQLIEDSVMSGSYTQEQEGVRLPRT
ncbi:hypothetical protein KL930_001548 [Ogataea haglerorum]|uniref:Uncharacterized protein n=1 Tax=Ogataea haglerorum TaxID=1937702 RepID=A0AAN6D1E0_9ASCO|nr:uncharacterized protein KL911_004394 [Ogataea haglerorum]KAG7692090.1 hypothetical protein KL915_004850 [Ogataea haglerorum]KAG7698770.1 hypothetical protein KL951_002034 [Ogataea haglerorum]KAG7703658.1 hypothetical protein KL914_004615 [Ogataea haglerorum]KAG7704095.1 hypothetical protein KL950_004422 [Ogataea haglerorum]KAG7714004.1 hypothetical protein KL913_004695 [Ogataea haglerorum]